MMCAVRENSRMTDGALDHSMLTDGTTGGQCAVHRRVGGCRQDRGSSHRRARLFASSGRVGRARCALTLFGIFEIHESAATTPRCLSASPPHVRVTLRSRWSDTPTIFYKFHFHMTLERKNKPRSVCFCQKEGGPRVVKSGHGPDRSLARARARPPTREVP